LVEIDLPTLRRLLRQLRACAPGIRSISALGIPPDALATAAGQEDLLVDHQSPDAFVVWAPGGGVNIAAVPESVRAMAVVAGAVAGFPTPTLKRSARRQGTLREWVGTWRVAPLLQPLLVTDAVGARSCRIPIPGSMEWLFAEGDVPKQGTRESLCELAVTGLGIGHFAFMPATLVCLAMLPPAVALRIGLESWSFCAAMALLAGLASMAGVALERWAERRFLTTDPREFVLDEVAGMTLTWAFVPPAAGWQALLIGFVLFRLFDIFKPGVQWVESLPMRGTIVWDDLVAGLYAGVLTLLLSILFL
jgi:phosphatidylglycerophosphatase A